VRRPPSAASERAAERRRREDEAPRLATTIPSLESVRLEVEDWRPGAPAADAKYVRYIVQGAPALFLLPCGDPACKDGGHDLTSDILSGLRQGRAEFSVEDGCAGTTGSAQCPRTLKVSVRAVYKG
jgi:hypothetical protein